MLRTPWGVRRISAPSIPFGAWPNTPVEKLFKTPHFIHKLPGSLPGAYGPDPRVIALNEGV